MDPNTAKQNIRFLKKKKKHSGYYSFLQKCLFMWITVQGNSDKITSKRHFKQWNLWKFAPLYRKHKLKENLEFEFVFLFIFLIYRT